MTIHSVPASTSAGAPPAETAWNGSLESLNAAVGRLSHDVNNLLAPLLGYATLIKDEVAPDSQVFQYAETIESVTRRAEAYLERVLLAVRPNRRYSPKTTDFTALIEQGVAAWSKTVPASAQVGVKLTLVPSTLWVDGILWQNCLKQLLSNAHFALATGGSLEITLEDQHLGPERMSELGLADRHVIQLVIRDNGFGMSEQTLQRCCEPFFTTRAGSQSLGLGLTLVQSVVRLHGGHLQIASIEDAGTTVTIWLPVRPAPPEVPKSKAQEPLASNSRPASRKTLLVEDDPMVREVIKASLQKMDLDVFVATDGVEGLQHYKRHGHDLALVVSDITMPRMNGIDLCRAILEQDPNLRIILVSGDLEVQHEVALSQLSGRRPLLVKKPFPLKAFQQTVRDFLAGA